MNKTLVHALWRFFIALIGILFFSAGAVVILHALAFLAPLSGSGAGFQVGLDLSTQPFRVVMVWMGGALVALVLGALFILLALARTSGDGKQIVLKGLTTNGLVGSGRVTVAQRSLRALAAYTAERVVGVREASPRLRLRTDGWHIDCRVSLTPAAALPEVTAQLKAALHDTIEHHTGLPVARVNIAAQLHAIEAGRRVR